MNGGSRRGGHWAGRLTAVQCNVFSPIFFLNVIATATEGQGEHAVSSREAHPRSVVPLTVVNALLLALASALLSLLSLSLLLNVKLYLINYPVSI
jgi:hypothetical protein